MDPRESSERCSADKLIERALEPFKNDPWMQRRLKLDEIIGRIEEAMQLEWGPGGLEKSNDGARKSQQALALDWIRFVEFLRDQCSGQEFGNDKQWGQLMNFMGVSRKLNHRSAKFNDIIKCKHLIQANAGEICELNETVRFQVQIERLIEELKVNIGSCQLSLLLDPIGDGSDTGERNNESLPAAVVVDEICKSRHHLESTCGPIIYTLSVQFQAGNKLKTSNRLDATSYDNWTSEFASLKGKFDRLCQFLDTYKSLSSHLAYLSPLVSSFNNGTELNESKSDVKFGNIGNDLLQDSLALCRLKFKRVLEFHQKLKAALFSLVQQHRQLNASSVKLSKSTIGGSNIRQSQQQQQVVPLQLVKLLTVRNEFSSDLYSIGLDGALVLLTECRDILDKLMQNLRLEYGRFYFLNDLELLTIISLDSSLVSQCHLASNRSLISKIFNQSIESFTLVQPNSNSANQGVSISGVVNTIGEKIILTTGASECLVPLKKRANIYSLEIVRILNEVLRKLRASLRQLFTNSIEQSKVSGRFDSLKSPQNDIDWSLPIQLLELIEQTKFTHRVELVLNGHDLGKPSGGSTGTSALGDSGGRQFDSLIAFYEARFESLKCMSELAASDGRCQDQGDSKQLIQQLKVSIGVSTTVHFLSILMKLRRSNVHSPLDWNWFKLPRYYYTSASADGVEGGKNQVASVQIRIANTSFAYKFDLLPVEVAQSQVLVTDHNISTVADQSAKLPNGQHISVKRLIATETSERCFLVASQSVAALKLGASPFGPAGSGKTETIKALGQLVGCQVIVHNCDETNESDALERLVWGLAHTGLWGCFDEFNRLSSNTLSRVSEVLELVQSNLRLNRTNVELADGQIKSIDPDSAFFITLNPGDSLKYRGRRRLPANLRALFLPIAMVRVQIDSIVSGILLVFSASSQMNRQARVGAKDACSSIDAALTFEIGRKLANWIDWTRDSFGDSLASRCEWDLRLVMVILKRFKILVLNWVDSEGAEGTASDGARCHIDSIIVKSIRCEVEPRLGQNEIRLLDESIKRFFGDKSSGLQSGADQEARCNKLIQFSEQLKLRAGVILLGKTKSGKSACWRNRLKEINANNSNCSQVVQSFTLNPKSYDKNRLYGYFDETTHKWIDGIFTKLVRGSLSLLQTDQGTQQVWIVLDGGVDPDWIECLNSVLDDNQVLTLSSGERLNFVTFQNKHIKLIIETDDISYASPATISRLGLVYFETNSATNARDSFVIDKSSTSNLILIHGGSEYQQRRSIGKQYCQKVARTCEFVEYNCSEFSTSEHLVEILMQNQETCKCYLINNLDLIQASDKWGTRSFVELLRYAISYKCYYATQMNCIDMGDDFKFIVTLKDGLEGIKDKRLISLASVVEVGSNDNPKSDETISTKQILHEALEDFLEANLFEDASRTASILLLKTENIMEFTRQTCELIQGKFGKKIELFTFNNSIAQVSSMHKLSRLTGEATTTTTSTTAANASDNPAVTQSDDKLVAFLINSFELKFLAPSVKRKLYHSANKLRAMHAPRYHRVVFLIYYMNPGGNESDLEVDTDLDYIYWLSMSEVVHEINQASQLSEAKLQNSLTSKFKEDRRATGLDQMDWLAGQVGNMFKDKHYQTNAHNTASSRQAFMNMLVDIILKANESIDSQRRLLSNGLDKLNEFEASVARLEAQREAENELLASKKLELESLMSQIEVKMRASEQKRKESQELERLQQIKSREIAEQKRKIKEELSEVLPLIEQSKQEVGKSLRPEALNEIKTLRSPPKTIKDILDVLFIFLDVTDTTWAAVKAYLNKYSLRDELTNYDFERRLTKPLLAKIKQEIKLRHDSFQMQQAKRASSAIVPIVKWIEAAIQYGQVLIVLGPLRENLQGLERESKRVSDSVAALENERVHLEDTIERNRKKLGELDRNYLEAKRTSEQINCDLDKARDVIRDSKRQTQMWHSKLESLEQLSTDKKQLYRLSLVCSLVAIFGDKLDRLVELIKVFDTTSIGPGMGEKEALEFYLRNYYNVLMDSCDGEPVDLTRFKQHEWHQVLQLVNLKLCAHFGHYPLVPYLMFDKTRETNTDELANLMCSNNIVCSRDDLVVLQPFGENATNWRQLAELARQMNKLTLIKIYTASDSSIAATVLDIFDLAKSNSRLVLFGNIGPMQTTIKQIEMMSRPVHVLASVGVENSALEGVAFETVITETLMQYYDPKLSEIVGELELELQTKQKEAKQLELSLVKRLMSWSASSTSDSKKRPGGDLAAPLSNDLVQMLSNLHQARESLANNIADIKVKLKEYHSKQERFLQVSRRAAIFYELFIANLQDVNQFYSLPLSSYVKILTETRRKNLATANQPAATTVNSIEFGEAEFVQVLTHVMSSMRPNYRSKFQAKLLAADSRQSSSSLQFNSKHKSVDLSAGSIGKAATLAANFQQAIIEQLVDLSNKARGQPDKKDSTDSHWFKLIVVLHDAKRPSPQVIVDELFRHNNSKTSAASNIGECQYYKLYASGDLVQNATSQLKSTDCKTNPLELQLSRIIDCMELQANQTNAAGNADHFTSKSQSGSGRQVGAPIRCVCVANAHLASSWINSRLLELIKERTRNKKRTVTSAKLMIILIAESESSDSKQLSSTGVVDEASTNATGDSGQFVQNLLDSSELKFWYDELALNLSDRYNLYYKLICDNYIYQDLNRVIRLSDNSKARFNEDKSELFDLDTLVKDLVLLHVVCQELVKLTSCREALGGGDFDLLWHKDYYNFDYEQLCLALKMLKQIVQDNASRQKGATSSISTRQSVRYLFGHLLETIVYGSRMETLHDEQLLERLLRQLIHSTGSHSVREQLMNFIRKLETSRGEQIGLTSGTPGSESLSAQIELKNAKELSRIIAIVRQE